MAYWLVIVIGVAALAALYHRRRAGRAAWGPTRDQALVPHVVSDAGAPTPPRPNPLDDAKSRLRASEGGRVRLRGAVVDGSLSKAGLARILLERDHAGEQAKAMRILLRFYPLPEAVPVIADAIARRGPDLVLPAQMSFAQCRTGRELDDALRGVGFDDEPWLLGTLLIADTLSRRRLCGLLAEVGGRRSYEALAAMSRGHRPTPWVLEATERLRARLDTGRGGGLALADPSGDEGGLSAADDGHLSALPSPGDTA